MPAIRHGALPLHYLAQRDQVAVGHLLPLVHKPHTLGVDQPVAVDPPQAHVLPRLDVNRLIHRGDVAEGGGLVQGRSSGRF